MNRRMLMLDRYLVGSGRALDLATGAAIRLRVRRSCRTSSPALFAPRGHSYLIDLHLRPSGRVEIWERIESLQIADIDDGVRSFRAALADARDGRPRALDLVEPSAARWAFLLRVLAREARLAGFVPIAAQAFGAVMAQARWRWPSWLKDRAVVLFATETPQPSPDATLALFKLATKDARPHLIVRGLTAEAWRPRLVAPPVQVHESAPADGCESPETLVRRAEGLIDGRQFVGAEAMARWSILLSDDGGQAAARCALARSLIGQRRLLEARAALAPIDSSEAAVLRTHIAQHVAEPRTEPAMIESFLEILRTCQDCDDPVVSLTQVASQLHHALGATSVAFVVADRNRPQPLAHAGAFAPAATHLAAALRAIETGVAVPSSPQGQSDEAAWPVRYGGAVVGALWCHWSMGVPVIAQDLAAVLGLAATAAAPAVHEARERSRTPAVVASLVPDLIGESAAIQLVRQAVMKAASSPFPVLIEGESGSGKELVARAVHAASIRRGRRFCALNCAAIADDLVEAELFGHTRGAFTGAVAERVGLFEEAQGGTLFLDEVAELSARIQAKLLRTLQEGEVRRLGEAGTRKVDARILAATNRPLGGEVAAGRFRNDLRYRLDVLRITIPPLRERIDDLPALVRHIWSTLAARTGSRAVLSPTAMSRLGSYDWPGNVRELQNVLASIMVTGPQRGVIGAHGLPHHIARASAVSTSATLADARREFEARYVRAALSRTGGRSSLAARELGVSRQGLKKLIARLGLSVVATADHALE
jgi:DNA-binding NtrC family response regulator